MTQQPQGTPVEPVYPSFGQSAPEASGPGAPLQYPDQTAPLHYPDPATPQPSSPMGGYQSTNPPVSAFPPPADYPSQAGPFAQYPSSPPTPEPGRNAFAESFGGLGAGPVTPAQERNWAMLAHLIPLITFVLSAGTLGIIASLVIYLLFKDRGPFVRAHAATSLNFQIMVFLGLGISVILMLLLVGFITYPAICVFAIVVHAIGASKASSGQWYKAPLTPTMIR